MGVSISNYWDMMGVNTPILEYLLSIYANSFDYSFLKCKAKIKIQRYIKEHQEPIKWSLHLH